MWLCDSKKKSNVYLIAERLEPYFHEYSRVGLFTQICVEAHRFGQPFASLYPHFYWGVHGLSAELAVIYRPYRRILTRILIDNPGIRKLPVRTRFKKLIHEPWKALQY